MTPGDCAETSIRRKLRAIATLRAFCAKRPDPDQATFIAVLDEIEVLVREELRDAQERRLDLPRPQPRLCSIPGCGQKRIALGYCWKHYQRVRQHGDPLMRYGKRKPAGNSPTASLREGRKEQP